MTYVIQCSNQVSLSTDAKRERVEAVLSALGLKPCRDVLIGDPLHRGISGASSAPYWPGDRRTHHTSSDLLHRCISGM